MKTFKIVQPIIQDKNTIEMWLEPAFESLSGTKEEVIRIRLKTQGFQDGNTVAVISKKGIRLTPFSAGFGIAVDNTYRMKVIT